MTAICRGRLVSCHSRSAPFTSPPCSFLFTLQDAGVAGRTQAISVTSFVLSNANVRRHYATEFGGQISEVNSTAICQYSFWLKYSVMYNCHGQYCMRNGC